MTLFFSSSFALAGLLAQTAPAADVAKPVVDDLSVQFDSILAAPNPPSELRTTPSPVGTGLMNPDISVIFDGVAGASSQPRRSSAGDDPHFSGPMGTGTGGFSIQEIEIGFRSTVDPYLQAAVYLAIPNLEGVEVEEAYAVTTGLPAGLQLKAGIFRSAVGRQNEQHLHMQDFSLRPLINQSYLGVDGLRSPGAQLSWLLPLPFFLRLTAEAMSVAPTPESPTFGGALGRSPIFGGNLKTFVPLSPSWSLFLGGSCVTGHAPPAGFTEDTELTADGPRSVLAAGDLYLKYMPPNRALSYFKLALQSEYFWRHVWDDSDNASQSDAGFYVQVVAQLARRFHTGARFDQVGAPESTLQPKAERWSVMAMFTPSEFSRVRLQGGRETMGDSDAIYEALLLLEYSIGAHGAHPF